MTSVSHDAKGRFISALRDLVPALAISPHQVAAVTHPERPTKAIPKRKSAKRVDARKINHQLSGKGA